MRHMDYKNFRKELLEDLSWENDYNQKFSDYFEEYKEKNDNVNSPAHYTRGKVEAIEIIEDAIKDAPTVKDGMLQAQALKYLLRLWLKDNPCQDAQKAEWYLKRLIESLKEST